MEGKAALFKNFGGVNTIPICVDITDKEEFIDFVKKISINFSGINLEDIKAPECFEIERRLDEELEIPIFHDDQHGTAIVVYAALKNALKIVKKDFSQCKIVVSGAGAAGIAISKLLLEENPKELLLVDSKGILNNKRTYGSEELEKVSISKNVSQEGDVHDAIVGADIFIGVSRPNLLDGDDIRNMSKDSIVLAMSNPDAEITKELALSAGAKVYANGRSDCVNQVNNLLAFPGLFAGVIKSRKKITHAMKVKTAEVIAGFISKDDLAKGIILPSPLNKSVHKKIEEEISLM
jgi:malate dehydrogenase (oxaloacetate-decarboxylating)